MNNAARHSRCTAVAIAVRAEGSRLTLEVTDNGIGFEAAAETDGNGVASMKRRATRLGASLDVVSAPGVGTTVQLTMTVPEWRSAAARPTQKGR